MVESLKNCFLCDLQRLVCAAVSCSLKQWGVWVNAG